MDPAPMMQIDGCLDFASSPAGQSTPAPYQSADSLLTAIVFV
jgi:hypothetical protein